ncbi:Wadjet anti-phage system protein JetD domain-containing protein [Robinsoniella peoriensis]
MTYEEKILTFLADHYRESKKDSGEHKTNRRTKLKPEKLYKKYNANDGNFEEISKLNQAVEDLSAMGFLTSTAEAFGTQLQCIYLIDEKIQEIEQYLAEKYGYISKDMKLRKLRDLIDKYQNASPICKIECAALTESMGNRKIPKNIDELDDVLKAVAFIEGNQEVLYIREVSMKVYGDSKFFENETLQPVCKMLRKYSDRIMENEMVDEILLDFHIAKEPQKLCIRGKVIINVSGKAVDISGFPEGIEFLASDLVHVQSVHLMVPEFMTIENRTSYLRYHADNIVTFYLGGFADRYQRDFLKLVYSFNQDARYKHFGDIDAGGFWIHHNLCEVTEVDFELFGMSVNELQNMEYTRCLHQLSHNDRARLQELKEMDTYAVVINYMLERDVKLEQEIVSLTLMNGINNF